MSWNTGACACPGSTTWRGEKPPPLVDRYLRMEVTERLNEKGDIDIPLDEADVERALDRLLAEDIDVLAVCLLHFLRQRRP